jgi:hypothetical protein
MVVGLLPEEVGPGGEDMGLAAEHPREGVEDRAPLVGRESRLSRERVHGRLDPCRALGPLRHPPLPPRKRLPTSKLRLMLSVEFVCAFRVSARVGSGNMDFDGRRGEGWR